GQQHRANDYVRVGDVLDDVAMVRVQHHHIGWHYIGEVAQTIQRQIEDDHLGAETCSHARGVRTHNATAQHNDLAWMHARHTAEQHAASAKKLLEIFGAFLHRHAAGDFAH